MVLSRSYLKFGESEDITLCDSQLENEAGMEVIQFIQVPVGREA